MSLTAKQKESMHPDDFAVPGKKKLPIHDRKHTELAWRLLSRTQGLTDAEIAEARKRILKKAKSYGIDTSKWETKKAPPKAPEGKKESFKEKMHTFLAPMIHHDQARRAAQSYQENRGKK